ncbi:MAG: hypothetical protein ACOX5M_00275 [Bacillota bacterium]
MGAVCRAVTWLKTLIGLEPKVIRRPLPELSRCRGDIPPATADEVCICIEDLAMCVRSSSDLNIPYELTVVVPRAEVTRRYVDGKLAEVTSTYSSITIARSPRPSERPARRADLGSGMDASRERTV